MDISEQIERYKEKYPPVDIYAPAGTKMVFHGRGGYPDQNKIAHENLKVGETYTLQRSDVGGWETSFYLEGFDNIAFNSVLFSPHHYDPVRGEEG